MSFMHGRSRGGYRGRSGSSFRGQNYTSQSRGGYHERPRDVYTSRRSSSSQSHNFKSDYIPQYDIQKSHMTSLHSDNGFGKSHYDGERDSSYRVKEYTYKHESRSSRHKDEVRRIKDHHRPISDREKKYEKYKDNNYDSFDRKRSHESAKSKYESSVKYNRGPERKRPTSYEECFLPYKKQRIGDGYSDSRSSKVMFSSTRKYIDSHSYEKESFYKPRESAPKRYENKRSSYGGPERAGSSHRLEAEKMHLEMRRERETRRAEERERAYNEAIKEKERKEMFRRRRLQRLKIESRKSLSSRIRDERSFVPYQRKYISPISKSMKSSMRDFQVTIKENGKRTAVSGDGFIQNKGSMPYIDLTCPHCPNSHSMTFQSYKYHLDSKGHHTNLKQLAYKHSSVLRKIRQQQRQDLRELEDKWKEADPSDFDTLTTQYCNICKLAYKAPSSTTKSLGSTEEDHNETKYHKMQNHYLSPHCSLCEEDFGSRMIYEYHIATIRHLKLQSIRTAEASKEDKPKDEPAEEINLTEFITMDSVGDEEIGTEHEEITGNLEEMKAAEAEAEAIVDDEQENETECEKEDVVENEKDVIPEEIDMEELNEDEEEQTKNADRSNENEEPKEPIGMEYVVEIKAVYCGLCNVAIRLDVEGEESPIEKHCRSDHHYENHNYMNEDDDIQNDLNESEAEITMDGSEHMDGEELLAREVGEEYNESPRKEEEEAEEKTELENEDVNESAELIEKDIHESEKDDDVSSLNEEEKDGESKK